MQVRNQSFETLSFQPSQNNYNSLPGDILNNGIKSPTSMNKQAVSQNFISPNRGSSEILLNYNNSSSKLNQDDNYGIRNSIGEQKSGKSALSFAQDSAFQKSIQLNLLKIQNNALKNQKQKMLQSQKKLRSQLQQKALMLRKFNDLMKTKYTELKEVKLQLQSKNKTILSLQQQNSQFLSIEQSQKLKKALFLKNKQLDQLNAKINNCQNDSFKNEVYQMKLTKLSDQRQEQKQKNNVLLIQNSKLNQKIRELDQSVQTLIYQKQQAITLKRVNDFENIDKLFKNFQLSPSKSSNKQATHLAAFDQALKVQMKQIQQLKQTIQTSKQLTQKLRDNLISSRMELQELRNQMKIMDLKANSQRKKLIMEYRLQIHQKDNEINSNFKKFKTLEEKYKNSLVDIKAKDQFFRQHLVGRVTDMTVQEYIEQTLNKYTTNFEDLMSLKTENGELLRKLEKYRIYEE